MPAKNTTNLGLAATKTSLFSMISVEGDFVRTGWYGLRRIRHKAWKYRRFGGVRIILDWHQFFKSALSADFFYFK